MLPTFRNFVPKLIQCLSEIYEDENLLGDGPDTVATVDARDYDITAYGAKSDTAVLSTQALQQAPDARPDFVEEDTEGWGDQGDPRGPWAPLHLVKRVAKWEDPCPFWDEDGQAYPQWLLLSHHPRRRRGHRTAFLLRLRVNVRSS